MLELVYSKHFLEHDTGSHPECRERLSAAVSCLKEKGLFRPKEPEKIPEKRLFLVHEPALIEEIKRRSAEKNSTADNIFNENTFGIALLAAAAALKAAELSREGFGFSLARPPGHHAGKAFFGGFCYFNSIAFAVKSMQEKGFGKALILDFDMHHGNGTQDIFREDKRVFYLSLHQKPELTFPGTGFESENNSHVMNVPLAAGTTDAEYLEILSKKFSNAFDSFRPELVAVSAGFDIFFSDKSVGNMLAVKRPETFAEIGRLIKSKAIEEGIPCFGVLEGGYSLKDFPLNLFNFLNAFEQNSCEAKA